LLLFIVPWSEYWDRNYFGLLSPAVHAVIVNYFVRGAVSGLGLLNIVAAFSEFLPSANPPK
jgi:hypothetical protein